MKVSYEGIGQLCASFSCGADVTEGTLVKASANGTVSVCAAGEEFCGAVAAVSHDGTGCSVQLKGFVTAEFTGAAPAVGFGTLCADGAGGVKTGGSISRLIVAVDGTKVTFML